MIGLLARLFRGLHWIVGATAPAPGENERAFVLVWVGIIVFTLLFCAALLYAILYVF
ncbi:MAG TPA: hypothetical protein VFA28_21325 [Bryobacteraceae bacterium]|nr:hypothetical protein [Bryobacteraceae bacterium]